MRKQHGMKLNPNQIKFILDNMFEDDHEIYDCLDCCDHEYLSQQDWELMSKDKWGWCTIVSDGRPILELNFNEYASKYDELLMIE